MTSTEDRLISLPGGRVFVRLWGRPGPKPPILLLHDSLGCIDLWRDFPAALSAATGRQVIAYDRLGFGRSDPHPGVLALDFIAAEGRDTLPVLLEQLRIDTFVLCGHSVGAGMSLSAAPVFPGRCRSVISMSAQAFVESVTLDGIAVAQATLGPGSDRIARLRKYHGDKTEWVVAAWLETWTRPAFAGWSLAPMLPRVHCPVLAIHGDKDEYGSLRHPETIRAHAGGPVQLAILSGCGHVPYKECPEQVFSLVGAFLDGAV